MKQQFIFKPFLAIAFMLFLAVGCKQDVTPVGLEDEIQLTQADIEHSVMEKLGDVEGPIFLKQMNTPSISTRSAITYLGDACGASGDVLGSPFTPCDWNYYTMSGTAGDNVDIWVNRTDPGLDPIAFLYFGMATDCSDVNAFGSGGGLTFIASSDDSGGACPRDCYSDPHFVLTLPSTGTYTIAVGNYASCGGTGYVIDCTDGTRCTPDADGDGCNDDVDPHPNSNQDATINIDGCDSGVDNVFIGCSTMMDLIADCAATAGNHGDFVSCVSGLTNDWKAAGLISGKNKGKIQSCAAQSNIP